VQAKGAEMEARGGGRLLLQCWGEERNPRNGGVGRPDRKMGKGMQQQPEAQQCPLFPHILGCGTQQLLDTFSPLSISPHPPNTAFHPPSS
jgi:hypothetical protein